VKTLIGRLSRKEGTSKAHHGTFEEDDVKQMKQKVKWDSREPFHVIPMVYRSGLLNHFWFSNFISTATPKNSSEE
jgi:transketolase